MPVGGATRWNLHLASFEKLLSLCPTIDKVIANVDAQDYISQELREYCLDRRFWNHIMMSSRYQQLLLRKFFT
jgi:hypothetical protein